MLWVWKERTWPAREDRGVMSNTLSTLQSCVCKSPLGRLPDASTVPTLGDPTLFLCCACFALPALPTAPSQSQKHMKAIWQVLKGRE